MLSRPTGRKVVIVSGVEGEAEALAARIGRENVTPVTMDCSDAEAVRARVAESTAVLSLLPATMHQDVALASIDSGVPLVTASYISEEMAQLRIDVEKQKQPPLQRPQLHAPELRLDRLHLPGRRACVRRRYAAG